MKKEILLKL